jgi:hypothetical protein
MLADATALRLSPPLATGERIRFVEEALAAMGLTSILPPLTPVSTLPESEMRALAAVGLRQGRHTRAAADSARARYAMTFLDLYRQADTPGEVAARLGLDASRIRQRLRDHTLLAIEWNGEKRIPRLQFEGDTEVPGVAKLVAATWSKMTPLAFAMWFTTPNPDLALDDVGTPLSPREWLLRTGDVDPVLTLANTL